MFNHNYDATIDYFSVLGIHYDACEKTVKMAYRKMARRYHPDVSKIHNATQKFQEVAQAYEILTKYREHYCADHARTSRCRFNRQTRAAQSHAAEDVRSAQAEPVDTARQTSGGYDAYGGYRRQQQPIRGKDRLITYPLTLRYAIRLLKIGYFYIPGLQVKMKFSREAFDDKTFRLKGRGYTGLFGGEPGDFLVRFAIKLESLRWELKGSDLYGAVTVPKNLMVAGSSLEIDTPSGAMLVTIPYNYSSDSYIKIQNMGLPADGNYQAGHLYTKLIAA